MPFYVIDTKGEEKPRMVKAKSPEAAIKHCTEGMFSHRTITMIDEAAPLFESGVKLEKVGEE